jgi:hypothetical protein
MVVKLFLSTLQFSYNSKAFGNYGGGVRGWLPPRVFHRYNIVTSIVWNVCTEISGAGFQSWISANPRLKFNLLF